MLVHFKVDLMCDDDIMCDVVHIDVCDVLLGRPRQSDGHSANNGFANMYTIKKDRAEKLSYSMPLFKSVLPQRAKELGNGSYVCS